MKPEHSTIVNVCIIPNNHVAKACEEMSQSLKSDSTMFTLGGDKFAHMTIFMARFANDEIAKVVEATEKVVQTSSAPTCQHSGYFMTAGRYFEVSYAKSDDLMQLHENLIEQLAQYRINPGQPYEEGYFTPYTKEQQKNAEETGYDLARNLFRPHITLTRYHQNQMPSVFPALPQAELTFEASTICVYKADDNGAVYEKLAEFRLDM